MAALGSLSALKAVGAGAVYVLVSVKQWVFTLSAIGVIGETELVGAAGAGMYLLFVLATQILVLPPIVVVVSLVFGIWFLFKGISGLVS